MTDAALYLKLRPVSTWYSQNTTTKRPARVHDNTSGMASIDNKSTVSNRYNKNKEYKP